MKQTAVEWLYEKLEYVNWMRNRDEISSGMADEWRKHYLEQAKAMERSQKAEEYLKGFKDGKEYQIKLDELTFGSNKQIMSTDIPFTNKDKEKLMEILNRIQINKTFKSK